MPQQAGDRIEVKGRSYVRGTGGYFDVSVEDLEWRDYRGASAQDGAPDPGGWRRQRTITGRVWHMERVGLVGILEEPGFITGQISIGSAGENSSGTSTVTLVENTYGKLYAEDDAQLMTSMVVMLPADVFDALWITLMAGEANRLSVALTVDFYQLEAPPGDGSRFTELFMTYQRDERGALRVDPVEGKAIEATVEKRKPVVYSTPVPPTPAAPPPVEVLRVARTIRWALPAIFLALALLYIKLTR